MAYVVCNACGLDSAQYSFAYLASWAGGEPDVVAAMVKESGNRIATAARTIIDALEKEDHVHEE